MRDVPLYLFISEQAESILDTASKAVSRANLPHYHRTESQVVRSRLAQLLDLTSQAVHNRNLGPILEHSRLLAEERFRSGYDLSEVQTAINVLEEAIWEHVVKLLPPADQAEGLGLCSTVLGAAKDRLAQTYVSLASHAHAPSLNLSSLFVGAEGSTTAPTAATYE